MDTHHEAPPQVYHWFSGTYMLELALTMEQAESAHHQGQCDEDVNALSRAPSIKAQLDAMHPRTLQLELGEYGAWDAEELADHDQNLQRVLWLAAGDITENPKDYA